MDYTSTLVFDDEKGLDSMNTLTSLGGQHSRLRKIAYMILISITFSAFWRGKQRLVGLDGVYGVASSKAFSFTFLQNLCCRRPGIFMWMFTFSFLSLTLHGISLSLFPAPP